MISELTTTTLVEWSRWQFAMTAIYHYMFVPLTLGLSFLLAIMETMWVRTGKAEWLNATKFWMKLFAINFAIGIATGLILEFQFGSNWSNYSWFVGDIFGAPLAIEGLFAFFLEATFFAVMFFGWNRVSRRFHLVSTWMVFIGSNISALWILVANAWMQNPVGMEFNPMTARNEMSDFWAVLLSPTAMSKFFHTVTSAYTLSACFVVGVSAWFILKKRHFEFARKSILLASVFGFLSIIATIFTGDISAQDVTRTQPMKLAAMEGLNEGGKGAPFTLIGLTCTDPQLPSERMKTVKYGITIPKLLSFLGYHDFDAYVPGIQNIMDGYTSEDGKVYPSIEQRMANGRLAIDALKTYKQAVKDKDDALASQSLQTLRANFRDFGYGYLSSPYDTIPPVPLVFYSFRLMVGLGMLFVLLFICSWWYAKKRKFEKFKFIPYLAIACVPLAYIASQCGWIVAEVGRQPWVVQNLMPTNVAITRIASGWVVTTFWMFAILFTLLLIAEIGIMFTQIRKGVKE
ncbi:cytochrome ubiquinol oxidase subunit I [Odoribacter splanchnicus]|uniref:cytochrome ubiquinol oxidase subunit I n=1 Tax=Odoribacter splanchnicus TaxID=28118 RepID=UPI001B3DAB72|nr:cytochrome ubiquinol oxidase subunit I [Odoribacter splanchnicus]MBP8906131.1 cytochrome ubiquinol oxidase subunit I [Odoribacter sp.]MDB9211594.1 cytochrome ubiquinol oxidase subunit I [Odoribacter splanchnicus]MDB9227142.1 cytochrome ubiquinol oxidase subunit I [Odoribacter splanchnicus]MDB9237727.1 cytochrome ubiquinol oxidase subunit I [Odoribacter splanchnicus]MDB9241749.1 cytochrome ubiquinol oxidase subunit I [Odoribacter splanchnicus]